VSEIHRTYKILRRLGEGGFGTVYQAVLTDGSGFEKLVALKMLPTHRVSDSTLALLRDEARVAGLLRDRAVVQVQAPMQLDGRWVVEMEYVDGASLARILKQHDTVPPRPALEIVAEIARALDSVVNQPGPDGRPLMLVHRDLKPGNVQLTPTGEVKILDFGAARSPALVRESAPTEGVTGTPGYIAPERFSGIDDPRSDVFSLGCMLHRMLTGAVPDREAPAMDSLDIGGRRVLALATRMCEPVLDQRMTAWDVEAEAQKVLTGLGGPRLREWASQSVPQGSWMVADDLVGHTLIPSAVPSTPPPSVLAPSAPASLVPPPGVAAVPSSRPPSRAPSRPPAVPKKEEPSPAKLPPRVPQQRPAAKVAVTKAPKAPAETGQMLRWMGLLGALGVATMLALGCGSVGGMLVALSGW
jgi:serine/threonine protein kinase